MVEEITRLQDQAAGVSTPPDPATPAGPDRDGHPERALSNGRAPNGTTRSQRPATAGQARAIYAIARQSGADLDELLAEHGVGRVEELGAKAASNLIDRLKAAAAD